MTSRRTCVYCGRLAAFRVDCHCRHTAGMTTPIVKVKSKPHYHKNSLLAELTKSFRTEE